MPVYVDELRTVTPRGAMAAQYGNRWCHLSADTEQELHDFARRIGCRREWYQIGGRKTFHWYLSHYDLVPSYRARAVQEGAIQVRLEDQAAKFRAELAAARPPEGP